jgi:hypothetical protein
MQQHHYNSIEVADLILPLVACFILFLRGERQSLVESEVADPALFLQSQHLHIVCILPARTTLRFLLSPLTLLSDDNQIMGKKALL